MAGTKHIRPDDKKRVKTDVKTPIDRRSGWWPGGAVVCWRLLLLSDDGRLLAFLGWPEMQGGRARRRGDGLPGMAGAGNGPAAICGGDSAVFNQPLTIFLVVAMVWRIAVSFLCSYCLFWRRLGRFRLPGAGRGLADGLVGLRVGGMGLSAVRIGKGRGSGKRGGASQDGGRVLPHILPTPPRTLGWRKTGRGALCNPGLK